QAVLRRDVFSAGGRDGTAGIQAHPGVDRGGVREAARRSGHVGEGAGGGGGAGGTVPRGARDVRRKRGGDDGGGDDAAIRRAQRRLLTRAQIPTLFGAGPAAGPAEGGGRGERGAHDCGEDARRDGGGRRRRPAARRIPPLLGGRAVARAAFREDVVRQFGAAEELSTRLPGFRESGVPARGGGHHRLGDGDAVRPGTRRFIRKPGRGPDARRRRRLFYVDARGGARGAHAGRDARGGAGVRRRRA